MVKDCLTSGKWGFIWLAVTFCLNRAVYMSDIGDWLVIIVNTLLWMIYYLTQKFI